ncbi:tRNA-dihydrouridine synthase family protein [Candidatus Saccharibacteria bacterium]|nr:tRNA-dihydrouridine synthase family protein [Candidatus Saccharibacteria bacterium]
MNFWDNLPRPFFALAPMESVTDVAFRHVILHAGEIARQEPPPTNPLYDNNSNRPDIFFTEFTNAASFCSEKGEFSTRGRLVFADDEQPIVAQIWGKNPENFRQMSRALAEKGFGGIDINMGCPDKAVVKNGSGSALIENPNLAVELIKAAQESLCPISVKTRLGALNIDEWRPWVTVLLKQNLANLTVHLRTRKEMSKVPAHFELIPEILKLRDVVAPQTKITINGDIRDRAHGMKIWQENPGIDGFMIGRGVFANPFCFTFNQNPTREQLFELLNHHLDQFDKWQNCRPELVSGSSESEKNNVDSEHPATRGFQNDKLLLRKFDPLKHFFKIYVKDFAGAAGLRAKLYDCKNTEQVREVLKQSLFSSS